MAMPGDDITITGELIASTSVRGKTCVRLIL